MSAIRRARQNLSGFAESNVAFVREKHHNVLGLHFRWHLFYISQNLQTLCGSPPRSLIPPPPPDRATLATAESISESLKYCAAHIWSTVLYRPRQKCGFRLSWVLRLFLSPVGPGCYCLGLLSTTASLSAPNWRAQTQHCPGCPVYSWLVPHCPCVQWQPDRITVKNLPFMFGKAGRSSNLHQWPTRINGFNWACFHPEVSGVMGLRNPESQRLWK